MFKSFAATAIITSLASATAAIGGIVTAVGVVKGKTPTTAAQVTLGAVGVSVVAGGLNMYLAGRAIKKMSAKFEEATTRESMAS